MYKEKLFELISKEDVVIWAGAGMSLYAGYPDGKELKDIIIANLTSKEKKIIDTNLALPALAEEFYKLRGNKNALIKILKNVFLKVPTTIETHKILASIPHFKTLITTNYDRLFEDAYKQKANVIYSTKQVANIDNKKTNIFKVHGDLDDPDSIVLTQSDYNNFFKEYRDASTYWAIIRERLATNSVLFIGYNLEDPNVSVIFDRITDSLGDNRKVCFFVAPNLPKHKIKALTKKGINYINSKAEELLLELQIHLKDNIISNIENGETSADTGRSFLLNIDLLPELSADKNTYTVTSLRGINKDIYGTINLTITDEKETIEKFNDFVNGKRFGTFEVTRDKLLNADFRYGGVKFPNSKGIAKVEFKSNPKLVLNIDIRFNDGFEYSKVPVKIFGSPALVEIHLEPDNAELLVKINKEGLPKVEIEIEYQHKDIYKNVNSEIDFFKFLKRIVDANEFTIYTDSGKYLTQTLPKSFESSELLELSSFFLDHFEKLKAIENYYKIRFSNIHIDEINNTNISRVNYLSSITDDKIINYETVKDFTLTLQDNFSDDDVEQLKLVNIDTSPIIIQHNTNEIVELYGQRINIGQKRVVFLDTFITNLDAIIKREAKVVKIISKKSHISYTKIS